MGTAGFKRVARHLDVSAGRHQTLKWHVDYLLTNSEVIETIEIGTQERIECIIANNLAKNPFLFAVKGFGSSDCRCPSHLFFSQNLQDLENAKKRLVDDLCLKKEGKSELEEGCEASSSNREVLANVLRYTL
jgi:Uri superfamily endonuclease